MVQVEGIGKKPPKQHDIKLTAGDLQQIIREARRRAEFRGYASRRDAWGRGHVDTIVVQGVGVVEREIAPIVAGIAGEYAVGCLVDKRCGTKCLPDLKLRQTGDGGTDLCPSGYRLDVMARTRDYETFLVRSHNDYAKQVEHKCDAFVFATWWPGLIVSVHGWLTAADVVARTPQSARRGDHRNYEVAPDELLPMSRLFQEVESRKLWR